MKKGINVVLILLAVFTISCFFPSCKDDSPSSATPPTTDTPPSTTWTKTTFPVLKVSVLYTAKSGSIFAGTDSNGIYRSTDAGATWQSVNSGIVQYHINSITENSSGDLFAGTGGPAIYRSQDQGTSWTEIDPFVSGNANVYAIAVNKNDHIFAAMDLMGWVLRTTNGGTSWTALTVSSNVFAIYSLAIDTSGKIYAGTASGIYVSTNNGTSWTKPTTTFSTADIISLSCASNGCVWAGTHDQGLYCSMDRGVTWNASGLSTGRINSMLYDGTTLIIGTTANGVHSSKDNGTTISAMTNQPADKNIFSLTKHGGNALFTGTQTGIYRVAF